MHIISHRGNIYGPIYSEENKPEYIDKAIEEGLEVEIDIRIIDGNIFLGHDFPETRIGESWLIDRISKLWIHCKDINSAKFFLESKYMFKFFCHTEDKYVLTSTRHIWVHDLSLEIDEKCIIPLINREWLKNYKGQKAFAICSDYKNILDL